MIKEKLCYYYKLYGLNIKSDFYLSELSHSYCDYIVDEDIEVNIICGAIPKSIDNVKVSNFYYTVSDNEAIFSAEECGKFYISNGNTIIIEPIENPNYEHLKAYLLSRSFAILLFQRNTVALHSSSILINDKLYAFCGQSGAGKSTLSAALTLGGYKMLSDDLSVISFDDNNKPLVHSGFSQHKLCEDAIKHFNICSDNLTQVDYHANKFALPTNNCFINAKHRLSILIELSIDYKNENNGEVTLTKVKGHDKLQTVFKNTFNPEMMTDLGLNPLYLKYCLNIAKNIRVFKLVRPQIGFTIKEQIELIKKIQD